MTAQVQCSIVDKNNPLDLRRVEAIWRAVYAEELGWLQPGNTSAALHDAYHGAAEYVLLSLIEGGETRDLGTARIVVDSDAGLPIEHHCDLSLHRTNGLIAEVQRMMILGSVRKQPIDGAPFGAMGLMIRSVMHWAIARGVRSVVVNAFDDSRASPVNAFRTLGFTMISEPFHDSDLQSSTPSIAMLLDLQQALARGRERKHDRFIAYMLEHEASTDTRFAQISNHGAGQ